MVERLPAVGRVASTSRSNSRSYKRFIKRHNRKIVRYSLLVSNVLLLIVVITFVVRNPGNSHAARQNSAAANQSTTDNPLDKLSAADIAVNVARMANLEEGTAVVNNADSVNSQLSQAPADDTVIAKPQVVSTVVKTRKDIRSYTTAAGDTVSALATKFNVTSDSIRWSNNLSSDRLTTGLQLAIPPEGANGIVYTVKSGDTLDSLSQKYHSDKDVLTAFNDAEVAGITPGEQILIPNGSIAPPPAAPSYTGFAWGASAIYGNNGYDYGYCTWYVANRRAELGRPVPSNLGNAYSWYRIAVSVGLPTGSSPQVGAVAVNQGGNHVSVVEAVNGDGSFWVSEMNSHGQVSMANSTGTGGWGVRDYKLIGSVGVLKFIY